MSPPTNNFSAGLETALRLSPRPFRGTLEFDIGCRADLVVDDLVIIELESGEHLLPVHKKQRLT